MKPLSWLGLLACLSSGCVFAHEYRVPCGTMCGSAFVEELAGQELDPAEAACQPDPDPQPRYDCPDPKKRWPYRLAFLEFDDRGEMFDRAQLANALAAIDAAKADARRLWRPALLAVFVHGWKNNADDSSGNVWGFRQTLAGLAEQFGVASDDPTRSGIPVVGVYVGWRGAVTKLPIVEEATFFDRHVKSQNIASAHMEEALLKILAEAKGPDFDDDQNAISVLVGHSFGGAVLESALTQTFEGVVLNRATRHMPADLTIFLNEAQEATRSFQLIDSMLANDWRQDHCKATLMRPFKGRLVPAFEPPSIISVSSTGDYATRAFFPFGQLIARPFTSLRTYDTPNSLGIDSQRPMFFNTTAHMSEFQSHDVEIVKVTDPNQAPAPSAEGCYPYLDYKDPAIPTIHYQIYGRSDARNRTPYWVMHIPPAIVPDHSTIFTRSFRTFLVGLICAKTFNCSGDK